MKAYFAMLVRWVGLWLVDYANGLAPDDNYKIGGTD